MTADPIIDNAAMHRFEMLVGEDIAVAYYREQDGRVVLLHTEVPQQLSGRAWVRAWRTPCSRL